MRSSFRSAFSVLLVGWGLLIQSTGAGCGGDAFSVGEENAAGGSAGGAGGGAPGGSANGSGAAGTVGGESGGGENGGAAGATVGQGGKAGGSGQGGEAGNGGVSGGSGQGGDAPGGQGGESGGSGQGGEAAGSAGDPGGAGQGGTEAGAGQGGSDAGGSAGCDNPATYYKDFDKDGHGDFTKAKALCAPPEGTAEYGWSEVGDDCNDGNAEVFPGQTKFFAEPYQSSPGQTSFDYDCNGKEEGPNSAPLDPGCGGFLDFGGCNEKKGYKATTSAKNKYCGSTTFAQCFFQNLSCQEKTSTAEEPYRCR